MLDFLLRHLFSLLLVITLILFFIGTLKPFYQKQNQSLITRIELWFPQQKDQLQRTLSTKVCCTVLHHSVAKLMAPSCILSFVKCCSFLRLCSTSNHQARYPFSENLAIESNLASLPLHCYMIVHLIRFVEASLKAYKSKNSLCPISIISMPATILHSLPQPS